MLSNLEPKVPRKAVKRVGRGIGSGWGKTSGRGHKGQLARSGGGKGVVFEGGQTPLFQRLPKRGFRNVNSKDYTIVNLDSLNKFKDGETVDLKSLLDKNIIKKSKDGIKILAKGKLTAKKLTVKANSFSVKAKEIIEKSGGKAEVI